MKAAFYSGASGLAAYQNAIDTIGNNIANANTIGYKAQATSFYDLLYTDMYSNSDPKPLIGHGVRAETMGIVPGQEPPIPTGGDLDFAIYGDGWFAVEKNGQIQYTRNGCFSIGLDEDSNASLVTSDGGYVLDSSGERITLDSDDEGMPDTSELCDSIGVYTFSNPQGLKPVSATRYAQTEASGEATAAEAKNKIVSGFLEQSGVSLLDEMCSLMVMQRAYQMSACVIKTADENEQTVNELRR